MPNQPHSPSAGTARRSHILETLLTDHRSALRRQAAHHSHTPADAEDALQDACVQFMRKYDGPVGVDALRWMMLVTKRCAWAIGARQRRHNSPLELNSTDAPAEQSASLTLAANSHLDPALLAERAETQTERRAAVQGLKPDQRTALLLLGFGLSYREISGRQGWSKTKVALRKAGAHATAGDRADPCM
jgi:RNA polymerase sigma factor (sigma-70 family)